MIETAVFSRPYCNISYHIAIMSIYKIKENSYLYRDMKLIKKDLHVVDGYHFSSSRESSITSNVVCPLISTTDTYAHRGVSALFEDLQFYKMVK